MIRRTTLFTAATVALATATFSSVHAAAGTVFQDDFTSGTVANATGSTGALPGFWSSPWSTNGSVPTNGNISEAVGGPLKITTQATSRGTINVDIGMYSTRTSSAWNFFNHALKFSVDNVNVDKGTSNYPIMRFTIQSDSTMPYNSDDAFRVGLRYNGQYMIQESLNASGWNLIRNYTYASDDGGAHFVPTSFDITMNATDYTIVFHGASGQTDTVTGAHNFTAATWGGSTPTDGAYIDIEHQLIANAATNATAAATVGSVTVSTVPPKPASLGAAGNRPDAVDVAVDPVRH